jgi:hypothetical protein
MAYEQTKVPTMQSQSEIKKLVMTRGGTGVAFSSAPPFEGFEALMPIDGITYKIRITAQTPADSRDIERDQRRIWRVIFYHMKSVFEAAASGVMEFREMMLPYIVTKDDKTVGQHILPKLEQALSGRADRLLPAAKES